MTQTVDADYMEVINPRRRGKRRSKRRRNPVSVSARSYRSGKKATRRLRRRRSLNTVKGYFPNVKRHKRRRNPPFLGGGGMMGEVIALVKDGAIAGVGIGANNIISGLAITQLGITDEKVKSVVRVGTAVLIPALLGKFVPSMRPMLKLAALGAIANETHKLVSPLYLQLPGGAAVQQVGQMAINGGSGSAFMLPQGNAAWSNAGSFNQALDRV